LRNTFVKKKVSNILISVIKRVEKCFKTTFLLLRLLGRRSLAIGSAMGDRSAIRELGQYQKIVVQDLDELAETQEIVEAIKSRANVRT